jgi:hypothetical protein
MTPPRPDRDVSRLDRLDGVGAIAAGPQSAQWRAGYAQAVLDLEALHTGAPLTDADDAVHTDPVCQWCSGYAAGLGRPDSAAVRFSPRAVPLDAGRARVARFRHTTSLA